MWRGDMQCNTMTSKVTMVECPFCYKQMHTTILNYTHTRDGMQQYKAEGSRRRADFRDRACAYTALLGKETGAEESYAKYSSEKKARRIDCPFCHKNLSYDKSWKSTHALSCKPLFKHRQQSKIMERLDINGPYGIHTAPL